MGFSTVATQLIFFIAILGISAGLISIFSGYVDEASGAMSDKQQHITDQLRTDIIVTNIDNSSGHLHVFAKNIGDYTLDTECVELYVDSGWVNLGAAQIVDPSTDTAVTVWAPEDTIQLKPSTVALNTDSIHEVKVITCNGISDTEEFST